MKKTAVSCSANQSTLVVTFMVLAFLVLAFCGQAIAQGDVTEGAEKIALCVACHGLDGNMSLIPNVPRIGGQSDKYLLKQMLDIKSGARPAPLMTGMLKVLNYQDMADVAAYYASQSGPQGAAEQEKIALGETLYRAGNAQIGVAACSACHSPNGEGLRSAGYPALSGQDPAYTELQLRAFRDSTRQNDDAEVMRSISARLNDEEIAALASYVSGLR